jgi:Flp pilus assembly protein TadG
LRHRTTSRLGRFARDEDGAVTVEAVLWLPFFFAILVLITDVSFAFYAKAQAYRVLENGNRAYSVRTFDTTAEARTWMRNAIAAYSPTATVTVEDSGDLISSSITLRGSEIMPFGWIDSLVGVSITVRAQQYDEGD